MSDFTAYQPYGSLDLETLIHPWQSGRQLEHLRAAFNPAALPDADQGFTKPGEEELAEQESCCGRHVQPQVRVHASQLTDITVEGSDVPGNYQIKGIYQHESPVIGSFVSESITPGFYYKMRKIGSNRFLFGGRAMPLQSVGIGYGKRITFEGDTLNLNMNYFYSDTHPAGLGFSLIALQPGDTFVINDLDGHPLGEGTIEDVANQRELSTHVEEDRSVVKQVVVSFSCYVNYSAGHGLMPLQSGESFQLTAVAIVVKQKNKKKAQTRFIEKLDLPGTGPCTFEIIQQKL